MPNVQPRRNASSPGKADFEAQAEFRYQLRRFLRFSEKLTRAHGVTPLQYQLMLQLKGFPGRDWASIAQLAERLQAKHHGVVALVSRCESLGWVARRPSTSDARQVEVHLTAAGSRSVGQLAKLHRAELQTLQALLDDLSAFQAGAQRAAA